MIIEAEYYLKFLTEMIYSITKIIIKNNANENNFKELVPKEVYAVSREDLETHEVVILCEKFGKNVYPLWIAFKHF